MKRSLTVGLLVALFQAACSSGVAGARQDSTPVHTREAARAEQSANRGADRLRKGKGEREDTVLRAMQDELLRSRRLQLPEHKPPYFVSYLLRDSDLYSVSASFGAITNCDRQHDRTLSNDVRVGDYDLDNSDQLFANRGDEVPLEDNYDAIRNQLWLRTDANYKAAVQIFERIQSILKQRQIVDRPPSFSRATVITSEAPIPSLTYQKERWDGTVRHLSALFRDYPAILTSQVTFSCRRRGRWLANTEGSRTRDGETGATLLITAEAETKDGARVSDFDLASATQPGGLPSDEELVARTKKLADRVTALANATAAEEYTGPVLFEGQAAADLFGEALVPRLLNPTVSIMQLAAGVENTQNKPGKRILPAYLSVIDDPLATTFAGHALKGAYKIDDEGVPAQRVELIKEGVIQTFCSGRRPGRFVAASNGHLREGTPKVSQLFITTTKATPFAQLKEKLIEIGKDQGLKYVFIVRHLNNQTMYTSMPIDFGSFLPQRSDINLTPPTLLYKVSVEDGHEDLVRSARFANVSDKILRSIQAVGDDSNVFSLVQAGALPQTSSLVTPSVLISEMDIEKQEGAREAPMYLKNPYAAKSLSVAPPASIGNGSGAAPIW